MNTAASYELNITLRKVYGKNWIVLKMNNVTCRNSNLLDEIELNGIAFDALSCFRVISTVVADRRQFPAINS